MSYVKFFATQDNGMMNKGLTVTNTTDYTDQYVTHMDHKWNTFESHLIFAGSFDEELIHYKHLKI